MTELQARIGEVTERIAKRSHDARARYLDQVRAYGQRRPRRAHLSCGNLAHGFAACDVPDKTDLAGEAKANIAIVSAYNDMLSAHQPYERFPELIKRAVREAGAVAQFAGGVPAMCDGVTQGQAGMELSLISRDVIAMSTAVSLSHDMFDGALLLGICDKIVPGLVIGALGFGHLPTVLVPAGPMPSGLPNDEKARVRQLYAQGKVGRKELLASESASYHAPGTCTFYGTANSNQMLMEIMGLHLPGAAFVNPNTPLRDALTRAPEGVQVQLTGLPALIVDEQRMLRGVLERIDCSSWLERGNVFSWLMVGPPVAFLAALVGYPFVYGIWLSLQNRPVAKEGVFVGLEDGLKETIAYFKRLLYP